MAGMLVSRESQLSKVGAVRGQPCVLIVLAPSYQGDNKSRIKYHLLTTFRVIKQSCLRCTLLNPTRSSILKIRTEILNKDAARFSDTKIFRF
jgi:hypothetical protein